MVFPSIQSQRISSRRGFSMMEMVFVLSLMGVMAAMAVPRWDEYIVTQQVNRLQENLINRLFQARLQAIQSGQRVVITLFDDSVAHDISLTDFPLEPGRSPLFYASPGPNDPPPLYGRDTFAFGPQGQLLLEETDTHLALELILLREDQRRHVIVARTGQIGKPDEIPVASFVTAQVYDPPFPQ